MEFILKKFSALKFNLNFEFAEENMSKLVKLM